MKRDSWETLLRLFFPDRCICCGKVVAFGEKYCPSCFAALPRIPLPVCLYCGMALEDCACNRKRAYYQQCTAPFYYEGGIRSGLQALKFHGKSSFANGLAEEMAEWACKIYGRHTFDLAACVPMTPKRVKQRGYNQSILLAQKTAELLHLPFSPHILRKIFDNRPQHSLPAEERTGNVAGVFDCTDASAVKGKHVLLIDDIKTTGATLNECAKMLRIAGAQSVSCLCCAVVYQKRKKQ